MESLRVLAWVMKERYGANTSNGRDVWSRCCSEREDEVLPQSVGEKFAEDRFELNPPTHLDPTHPTTSFSSDQMIQFARAAGLEVSLAFYSMLEDLLSKARGGSGAHPLMSRIPSGRSPFPSVAPRSVYSMPTITETEGTSVIVSGYVVEEPCSSRQADARLAMGMEGSERSGTNSLKTLQQIKSNQKKRKSRACMWSREDQLNPLLPSGDDTGGYVFTEEMVELARFAKVFATGAHDLLENKYCVFCTLCRRKISMRTRGVYELKRHFRRECPFRADQRFREKYCPGKVRGRNVRVLYGSMLEAERDFYMDWTFQIWILKGRFIMMCRRESPLTSRLRSLVIGFNSIC